METAERIKFIASELRSVNAGCELIAATKTRTIEEIREAMATGLVAAAGENRVQELTEKFTDEFRWDFIGRLQTNKVKYVVGRAALIHSVDRLGLAEAIEKESAKRGLVTNVLVEINAGREESKGGIFLEETERFCERLAVFPHLRVRGMMAVAPIYYNEDESKRAFEEVYGVYRDLKNGDFRYLSMGMSNDYLIAAACGANLVRLGRAIFGERRTANDR